MSSIETEGDWKKIVYIYQNEPRAELADRSAIHKNAAMTSGIVSAPVVVSAV